MPAPARPWRAVADGVELAVRLTPRGGRARIDGIVEHDGLPCLKVRVAAPPVDGAANEALVEFLARTLGVPRSAIGFVSGETSRFKRLTIAGAGLPERLEALCGSLAGRA